MRITKISHRHVLGLYLFPVFMPTSGLN
uniref:Uncharacterized protein n=1 Tax=Anguilla anguilla TaxID=7936 RepID=A0A0E9R3V0_ANGAN